MSNPDAPPRPTEGSSHVPSAPPSYPDPIDPSIEFLYKPHSITALSILLLIFVYCSFQEYGDRATEVGLLASLGAFLLFSVLTFRDGPFIRPHPVMWRLVLALGFAYQLLLTYLLFQTPTKARSLIVKLDPSLGIQLPEHSYADNCELTYTNVKNQMDVFVLAHFIGWFGKAIILRDYWVCWILSIMFEVAEYSLQHQLPNFAECWWDHWIIDVLVCNWLGIYVGMKTCTYFEMKQYSWRGFHQLPSTRLKMQRAVLQFTPYSWTKFEWWTANYSIKNYIGILVLLLFVLLAELNAFYLKYILWVPANHWLNALRLSLVFACGIPGVREAYAYLSNPNCKRFGVHAWIAVCCVCTEILICIKYDADLILFSEFPRPVVWFWTGLLVFALGVYPVWQFVYLPYLNKKLAWDEKKVE